MRISDWSSDVCSSDLLVLKRFLLPASLLLTVSACGIGDWFGEAEAPPLPGERIAILAYERGLRADPELAELVVQLPEPYVNADWAQPGGSAAHAMRSEEHTSELQSLMRLSYAVF